MDLRHHHKLISSAGTSGGHNTGEEGLPPSSDSDKKYPAQRGALSGAISFACVVREESDDIAPLGATGILSQSRQLAAFRQTELITDSMPSRSHTWPRFSRVMRRQVRAYSL
jgi:hypothetical protein